MRLTDIMAWNEQGNGKDPWKRDGDEPNEVYGNPSKKAGLAISAWLMN